MEREFMKGCEAIAEAAVRAGCRFFAGYPITPQNEIPEYMARRMPEVNGSFVQGESEVASVNMIMGASSAGDKAMTSSSSCGISLKSEGISYIAGSALPAVIVNVMRGGPGGGSIQPSQQDYWQATKAQGNGGFKMIVFAPSTVQEAVDMTYKAFKYAERDRNPVMVLADGCIGAMMEPVVLPAMVSDEELAADKAARNDWLVNGKGYRDGRLIEIDSWVGRAVYVNADNSKRTRRDPDGPNSLEYSNKLAEAMYDRWAEQDTEVEFYKTDDAEIILTGYGTSARVCRAVVDTMRKDGVKIGLIRPVVVNPFPYEAYAKLDPKKVKVILDVEMSIPAQMVEDVKYAMALSGHNIPIKTFCRSGGVIVGRDEIINAVKAL
ncbi:MAG TPA: 3-methyl-2-oxobutanoate dehydrogenase subunit VorB [Candidatus Acidoferrum sp.]|nr:3-methyl-2-oxobutanoate dehydrogenase subunit VorB [Candidatus Acidoferrum sp.]